MKAEEMRLEVPVLEGVTVSYAETKFSAQGPKGTVEKVLRHPKISITVDGSNVVLLAKNATKREKMNMNTFHAHINNIMTGANEGYTYELKICSGHFPMSAAVKGETFELKNFLGEVSPRTLKLKTGAKVTVGGDIITVEATDKELTGQVSADLEKLTKITNRDRRIFQDGIYITKKGDKVLADMK